MTVGLCPSICNKISLIVYLLINARQLMEQMLDGSVHTIGGTIRMVRAVVQQPHKTWISLTDEMAVGHLI